MKQWFPSGKQWVLAVVAVALALWSLPAPPSAILTHHNYLNKPVQDAVPTLAVPTAPGAVPPTQPSTPAQPVPATPTPPADPLATPSTPFSPYAPWPTAKLRIRVIDGRTMHPLPGAEVVVIETEQRVQTDNNGLTPFVDAPVLRNPRFRPMVAELHGQLGVIVYKNGYRDSIHFGIRMHEGLRNETTVWMYQLGPGDHRVEPVLYQVPYHHIWLVQLADKFRSKTQPGAGPERP